MFLFINASVHDDVLANLAAAATLYVTARFLVRGPTTRRAVAMGLLVGLGLLTKLTCLLVAPTVGLALLIGGWWFARNVLLYGEPTSMVRQTGVWGGRENAPNLAAAARELGFLHDSFWGVFGYRQIPMPHWVYELARLFGVMALGGLILFWARRRTGRIPWEHPPAVLAIMVSAPLVTLAANFARMTVSAAADFGRYLFVSLSVLAVFYALGLSEWFDKAHHKRRWLVVGLATVLFALAVFALVGVLMPAYAAPQMLSREEIAARTRPADLYFGESIRLIGYELDRDRVLPGDEAAITLCWEALAPLKENYVYFVHLLGPEESIVGARRTHPGLSRYPTSRWTPGDVFCDVVRVPVEKWAPAPAVYDIESGWYDPETGERLSATNADGAPVELVLLDRIKVAPEKYATVEAPNRVDADLDGQVTLLGYSIDRQQVAPGQTISLTLYWTAQAPVPADYTVFVHLAAPDGSPYAQDDCQPQRGAYPTSFWDVGEVVTDPHTILVPGDLPAGRGAYPLVMGMYLLETGERLRWLSPDGTIQGDFVSLDTIAVHPDAP